MHWVRRKKTQDLGAVMRALEADNGLSWGDCVIRGLLGELCLGEHSDFIRGLRLDLCAVLIGKLSSAPSDTVPYGIDMIKIATFVFTCRLHVDDFDPPLEVFVAYDVSTAQLYLAEMWIFGLIYGGPVAKDK